MEQKNWVNLTRHPSPAPCASRRVSETGAACLTEPGGAAPSKAEAAGGDGKRRHVCQRRRRRRLLSEAFPSRARGGAAGSRYRLAMGALHRSIPSCKRERAERERRASSLPRKKTKSKVWCLWPKSFSPLPPPHSVLRCSQVAKKKRKEKKEKDSELSSSSRFSSRATLALWDCNSRAPCSGSERERERNRVEETSAVRLEAEERANAPISIERPSLYLALERRARRSSPRRRPCLPDLVEYKRALNSSEKGHRECEAWDEPCLQKREEDCLPLSSSSSPSPLSLSRKKKLSSPLSSL